MNSNPLGRLINLKTSYDPSLLFSISRESQREKNKTYKIEFNGYDIWNAYELSWLNKKGRPETRIARIIYSSDSKNIVESKSLKLYLTSFCMTKFIDEKEVTNIIKEDLSKILKTPFIEVFLYHYTKKIKYSKIPKKLLLDELDIKTN